jgi:hypothetical protein
MTEPSIDEMLIWVSGLEHWNPDTLNDNKVMLRAIRAILEQHREVEALCNRNVQLEAIRAFVKRVERRIEERYGFGLKAECKTMREELAAMEKENDRTND